MYDSMIVDKNQIVFRDRHLQTEEGRMSQTNNKKWKKLKADIEKNGIINPLICTEKNGKYRLCIGMRRFIAGCILGIKEYEIEVVPDEEVNTLMNAISTYKIKHKDGTDISK
jgi:ParB-like chromosome segregation protein Spo0J